jgi:DNA repair photolyase
LNEAGEAAFLRTLGRNDAIVDPEAPQRVARDAAELRQRGQVILGRCFDPWCPAGQQYHLGRRFAEAILDQDDWSLQIRTKNMVIVEDYDIASKYKHRVSIGMVFTAPASRAAAMTVLEPHGSSNPERMGALWRAHDLGLTTHVVVESLLPRTSDSESHIDELVGFAAECQAEMILAKPLNVRGLTLRRMQKALAKAGYSREAEALESVKTRKGWSRYATEMALNFQRSCLKLYELGRLRFFLRPSQLVEEDISRLEMSDHGIHWIGGRRRSYAEVR